VPGALGSQYHKGGCVFGKALKHVGTVGFLAYRVEFGFGEQPGHPLVVSASGQASFQPGRLACPLPGGAAP